MLIDNKSTDDLDLDRGQDAPSLTERQKEEAADRTSVSAVVVHEAVRHDG
jgi:hypothetical protein